MPFPRTLRPAPGHTAQPDTPRLQHGTAPAQRPICDWGGNKEPPNTWCSPTGFAMLLLLYILTLVWIVCSRHLDIEVHLCTLCREDVLPSTHLLLHFLISAALTALPAPEEQQVTFIMNYTNKHISTRKHITLLWRSQVEEFNLTMTILYVLQLPVDLCNYVEESC